MLLMSKSYRKDKIKTTHIKIIPTIANKAQWLIFLFNIASTMRFNLSFTMCFLSVIRVGPFFYFLINNNYCSNFKQWVLLFYNSYHVFEATQTLHFKIDRIKT